MLWGLPIEATAALAIVASLLAAATIFVAVRSRKLPVSGPSELQARLRTWWIIVGSLAAVLFLGKLTSMLFFALVSGLALREYLQLVPTRPSDRRVHWWAYAAIPVQYAVAYSGFYELFIIVIPVYLFLLLPIRALIQGQTAGFINAISTLHWGLMATVFSVSHAAYLLSFQISPQPRVAPLWPSEAAAALPGPGLLLLLLILTEGNDVAQYVWGKSLGRRKVAPSVSPGKTWAGLIGGIATTALLAIVVAPWLTMLSFPVSLLLGLAVGIGGFFGDLTMSALKRDLGVKDSGTLLPGHGGILDRIDSLIYSAPLYFHLIYFLY